MAGPKKRPVAKATATKKDYVGPFDGSRSKWMTRRIVDKEGNTRKTMAPQSSKPSEASNYNAGYSQKTAKKQEIKVKRRGRK